MKRSRRRPTLEDLELFTEICTRWSGNRDLSMRSIAEQLDLVPSALTACLRQLEKDCKRKTLLETKEGGGIIGITTDGKELLDAADKLFKQHECLPGKTSKGNRRTLTVGVTAMFLSHLLPGTWVRQYLDPKSKVGLSFRLEHTPEDLVKGLHDGTIDFGIGPPLAHSGSKNIVTRTFKDADKKDISFKRFLVCSPSHRWATQLSKGERDTVKLEELKDEFVAYRPLDRHPTTPSIPDGGTRIAVDSYDAVVAFVRLGAVGIVPGFPWWLDPLRTEGAIVYMPIKDKDITPSVPTLYLRTSSSADARFTEVRKLVRAIEKHMQCLPRTLAWEKMRSPVALPVDSSFYEKCRHLYYVSHDPEKVLLPRWFHTYFNPWTVNAATPQKKLSETSDFAPVPPQAVLEMGGVMETEGFRYTIFGVLLGTDILSLTGAGLPLDEESNEERRGDRFVAVFNTLHEGMLLGYWIGRDDDPRRATTGPMILSPKEIHDVDQLHEITRGAQCNFLPNADCGLD